MKLLPLALAAALVLSNRAFAGDTVVTKSKHEDGYKMMGQEQVAKDTTEVTWIGKDRMRVEDPDHTTIVRLDQKKLYVIDNKAKTFSAVALPIDMAQYIPPELAQMKDMMSAVKVTVTPSTDTKKIKDWNTTRYTLALTIPMGGGSSSITQEMWVTKDVAVDAAALKEMLGALMSMNPMGGSSWAAEMKKVDGLPVMTERTRTMMGTEVKAHEEVTSIETKDAPAGTYDVPAGFTETPFDPMAEMKARMGGRGGHGGGGPGSGKPTGSGKPGGGG